MTYYTWGTLQQACGSHWHTPLAAVMCCSWGLVALWLQKGDIVVSADKHYVLTLENLMRVLPVEVLLAAAPHTNADQVLGYEHTRLQSVDLN